LLSSFCRAVRAGQGASQGDQPPSLPRLEAWLGGWTTLPGLIYQGCRRIAMKTSMTRFGLVLLLAAGLGACASVPPPESEVGKADLALRKAEQADAAHFAPLEMRVARTKLEAARAAMRDEENLQARRLAEQAKLDALLAETTAQAARRREAADTIRADIEALRAEAERASNRIPGETP
jgi:hypothetical protein